MIDMLKTPTDVVVLTDKQIGKWAEKQLPPLSLLCLLSQQSWSLHQLLICSSYHPSLCPRSTGTIKN
jgi:hypothetical protein